MAETNITTREELINALTEAAELEHGLLCQYLFAAFSMKKHHSEGVTWHQLELIRGWERQILRVAREEMAHLGTVCNLLTAIGGAPQFRRPNFPQPARYFPSKGGAERIAFTLEPFSISTVERFVRFEEPEKEKSQSETQGAARPQSATLDRAPDPGPDPLEYVTVGDLYGQISDAFETLDERELFIGPGEAQDADDWSANLKLRKVVNRETAVQAINDIVLEGEAPVSENLETSHWKAFYQICEALENEIKQDQDFAPAWPVVSNPLTRQPRDCLSRASNITIIDQPYTLEVAELFNTVYGTMMLMLMQFYSFAGEAPEQRDGLRATIRHMMSGVVRPLGEVLTRLSAKRDEPGKTAGPGFEFYTDLRLPDNRRSSWIILQERLDHEAKACKDLAEKAEAPPRLALLHENLDRLAANMQRYMDLKEL